MRGYVEIKHAIMRGTMGCYDVRKQLVPISIITEVNVFEGQGKPIPVESEVYLTNGAFIPSMETREEIMKKIQEAKK